MSDVEGVECWLAKHSDSPCHWVVRELPPSVVASGSWSRFDQEAQRLSKIESPHYSALVHCDHDDERIRLVHQYHVGETLEAVVARRPLGIDESLGLASDLLEALVEIHESKCVHRDWRPSHVILTSDRGGVLCGFSAVWQAHAARTDTERALEAVRFASPELAGIIKNDIGPASDLYSLGQVLYFALVGQPLCDGESFGDVLFQVSTLDLNPDRFPPEVPTALVELIERLLHKEPRERYQSASAVLHDVISIRDQLRSESGDAESFVIGSQDHRDELSDPAFVGREKQLRDLRENLESALGGEWRQLLISSESGMGKSRLSQEIARLATRNGFLLFIGDSVPYATSEPNGCWMQIVRQISAYCQSHPDMRSRLAQVMSEHREEVITAMPTLATVFGWSGGQLAGPDEFGQGRIVSAFGTLITCLGDEDRPVMITVDNCQWMDDQALRILQHINRLSASHELLILLSRTEEQKAERIKHSVKLDGQLELRPLDNDSVRRLCRSMAGDLPEAASQVVVDYAEGSPFMASAVLRGMVESGVLSSMKGSWNLDENRLAGFQMA
ncbi:MAG: AAA family ATPase, partial [Planctomycetota bacterium]